jgi:hypothetical protein
VLDADEISRRFPLIATEPYPMINDEGDEVAMKEIMRFAAQKIYTCPGFFSFSTPRVV